MGRAVRRWLIASAALLLCLPAVAAAQYFGRNKVQYDRERVLVLTTEHFDIYYSEEDRAAAALAARMAERWYAKLSKAFDHTLRGRQPVVLYGSHRRFEQTNVHGGFIDESVGGFTDSRRRRVVLPFGASLDETDHVLGHEIVHAFQFDIADRHRTGLAVPLWFVEGMAEYLTLGPDDPQTAMWMRDAVASGKLPAIRDLGSSQYFPYRWGAALWTYLAREFGGDLPGKALRTKRDVKRRLQGLTGKTLDELTAAWHAQLRETHRVTPPPADAPPPLISRRAGGGRLNLGASLSPDGRRLVFLSERDQFSIDLFLADAATGKVVRKLLTTATNPEFESLQYLHSTGAWDPEGTHFALATINKGRAALVVLDVDRPAERRELPLPDADEAYSPAWSPDGASIVFSSLRNGVSDLSLIDVRTGAVRQLTNDVFADLQPAWSPDGLTLAFATDRFTTDVARLQFGTYRIGLLDVASRSVTAAPGLAGLNHLNPVWDRSSGSDRALFFVADPAGIRNVFRIDLGSSQVSRVTDETTGVTGVTRVSPALSIAADTGALAFSVFRNGGFEIRELDAGAAREGTPVDLAAAAVATRPATGDAIEPVPPIPAIAASARKQTRYEPRLALEGIGSPYLSAGGGPFGGYVSAGTSMLFGDLLGDHQLFTALYVSSRLDESAFGAIYVNRKSRWSWGLALDQSPELRVRYSSARLDADRERTLTRTRDRLLWTNRRLGAFAAYPLNRSQRIEVSGGIRQIAFEHERRIERVSALSGVVLDHDATASPSEPSVGIADAGVALVSDTAIFGATAPMIGTRYRLQTTMSGGGLKYASVLADYRRYLMPVRPYTLALRIVHSGRYGGDAGDFRLRDSYVGSPTLVRGYGPSAVVRSECPSGSANCPALNSLLANRIVAAKLELRVPLWSTLTTSSRVRYGALPMDAFVFADAGAGWGGEQRFGPADLQGNVVRSVGAGVRVNVIGLIFEAATVKPLDLKNSGWTFAFNLRPGF